MSNNNTITTSIGINLLQNFDTGFNTGFIISPRTLKILSVIHIHFLKNRFIKLILTLFSYFPIRFTLFKILTYRSTHSAITKTLYDHRLIGSQPLVLRNTEKVNRQHPIKVKKFSGLSQSGRNGRKFILTFLSSFFVGRHLLRAIQTYTPYTPLFDVKWGSNILLTPHINHSIKDIGWS